MSFRLPALLTALTLTSALAAQGFGAVYTLSNSATGNEVDVALRLPGGDLIPFADYATGGDGTGAGLGSQGALAASRNGRRLVAVNAGSNEITLFRSFFGVFLWRASTVDSGGVRPTSVAMHGDLVYVLNADSDEVTGFRIHGHDLQPIPGATYALSQAGAAAAQVGFSPDGDWLVVTERATNTIAVYEVQNGGRLGAVQFNPSSGMTPFGFQFRRDGVLVVSEAFGGGAGASTASSYRVRPNGTLMTVTGSAPTTQTAACWIAIAPNGRSAYTTNTGSGTVTGFSMNHAGSLALLDPSGVSGDLGSSARPIDADFDRSGRYLYVLDSGGDRVSAFRRNGDGSLVLLTTGISVDDGSAGLIAR